MAEESTNTPAVPTSELLQFLLKQAKDSEAREQRLEKLLQQSLGLSQHGSSVAGTKPVPIHGQPRPELSSGATVQEFNSWKDSWKDYSQCQHLGSQDRSTRVAVLRQCFDEDLRRFLRQEVIPVSDTDDDYEIITKVESFIRQQRNTLIDRLRFYQLTQEETESFHSFLTNLKEAYSAGDFKAHQLCASCSTVVNQCQSCKQKVKLIEQDTMRDRIIVGIANDTTRHMLLAEESLTLDKAINICQTQEAAQVTQANIGSTPN